MENIVRIRASADLQWICCYCFLFFFLSPFIFLSAQAHIVRVWVDLHMCIHVLWVGAGHCWGLGFLSEDLLQASLQHARDLEVGLDQHYFSYFTSVKPAAYSPSCPQCRAGTDKPSYGEILIPFLCYTLDLKIQALQAWVFPPSLMPARCGHIWSLTSALGENMATAIMQLWLKINLNKCKTWF